MTSQMLLTVVFPQLQILTDDQVIGFCRVMKGICNYVETGGIETDKSDDLPDRA